MAKTVRSFVCNNCGNVSAQWSGRCSACEEWNTLTAFSETKSAGGNKNTRLNQPHRGVKLQSLSLSSPSNVQRLPSGWNEFDRVIGGGLVPSSAILMGGEPGIGKSTLSLQLAGHFGARGKSSLYVCGEESPQQIQMRAKRLGLDKVQEVSLLQSTNVDEIIDIALKEKCALLVVDSIQTMVVADIDAPAGSVTQLRAASAKLVEVAKTSDMILLLIGHVTKDGMIAGPKVIEHIVDCVLYVESPSSEAFRLVRVVKNRFGATLELGVFQLTETGLVEVKNPSALFLAHRRSVIPGTAVYAGIEGTRPMLMEIQMLVTESSLAYPRRACVGFDPNRLSMLLAVLESRAGAKLANKDVYLNVTGGIKISYPAADLAVAAAAISSLKDVPLPMDLVLFGELGLGGEVRPVPESALRLREAAKIGFKSAMVPKSVTDKSSESGSARMPDNVEVTQIETVMELSRLIA